MISRPQDKLLAAIMAKERCTKLYGAALRRHRGPTPPKSQAVYVARGNAIRHWAQQC